MADKTATYKIELEDGTSSPALTAAQALEQLDSRLKEDTKSLAAMQKAMKNLQGGSSVNIDQFRKLQASIDKTKNSIAKSQTAYVAIGGSFKGAATSGRSLESRLKEITKQSQAMPGPLGQLVSRFASLAQLVGGGKIALGIVAIAAALTALVVATGAAIKALYQYGVAQADARRSELLRLEGLTKMRFLFQRIPGNAKEMQAAIDSVSAKVAISREKVSEYNDQLYRMGLRGPALSKALEGVAIKSAVQGDAAAQAFGQWAAGAALTGRSVDKLVDKVKSRLGGIAQKQMSSLTVQTLKQKEAMDSLFAGLDMDEYLSAWKGVNDLLSQATASGRALKFIVTGLLQPLIGASTSGASVVKRFFQGMIISALQLVIVILQVRNAFRRTFGTSDATKGFDAMIVVVYAGRAALFLLIGALLFAGVVIAGLSYKLTALLIPALIKGSGWLIKFGLKGAWGAIKGLMGMASATWAALVPLLPFIAAAIGVGLAVYTLIKYWDELKLAFQQVDWIQAGKDMFLGLIEGLVPGGPALVAAMKDLASQAIVAFKTAIGSASPSKVFMRAGLTIPEGVAEGIDTGAPEAQAAAEDMVTPKLGPMPGAPGGALEPAGAAARGGGARSVTIEQVNVYASSGEPKQMAADFRTELEAVLQGLVFEIGAPVPA